MKFAFSRPTSNENEVMELFNNYLKVGYDGLQLKPAQYISYLDSPDLFNDRWGHLEGIGSSLIAAGKLDEENIELLNKTFNFAKIIKSEKIIYCHGISREKVTNDDIIKYAKTLSELGKKAEQMGIQFSLHHHYDQPVMYREDFDLFFEHVHGQSVGLTIDTAHLVKSGIYDIAEVITSFKDVIDNYHLKDFANGDWCVLGEGNIDFSPIFRAIRSTGFDGWISADEESGGEVYQGMIDCLLYMKKGLGVKK